MEADNYAVCEEKLAKERLTHAALVESNEKTESGEPPPRHLSARRTRVRPRGPASLPCSQLAAASEGGGRAASDGRP